jgi:hypothetical protein
MKARRSTVPTKVSPTHERALEITQHQKDVKNEECSSEFVENKGGKKCSSEFIENK